MNRQQSSDTAPLYPSQDPRYAAPAAGNANAPHYHAGQPAQCRPRRSRGKKIFLALLLIALLLGVVAEFGARGYIRKEIKEYFEAQTADPTVSAPPEPPRVAFGKKPVLLGLVRGKLPELHLSIPSSLRSSYYKGDSSQPIIQGSPAMTLHARDITLGDSRDMLIRKLDLTSVMTKEMFLAESQRSMKESQQEQGGDLVGDFMQNLFRVTDVTLDEKQQTLVLHLGGGIADLVMKPTVSNGELAMDTADVKLLGHSLPAAITKALGKHLAEQASATAVPIEGNLRVSGVKITPAGMEVSMYGENVNMAEVSASTEQQGGTGTTSPGQGGQSGSGQPGQSGRGGLEQLPTRPQGSSGDPYGPRGSS